MDVFRRLGELIKGTEKKTIKISSMDELRDFLEGMSIPGLTVGPTEFVEAVEEKETMGEPYNKEPVQLNVYGGNYQFQPADDGAVILSIGDGRVKYTICQDDLQEMALTMLRIVAHIRSQEE